jgi:hypothetical protein
MMIVWQSTQSLALVQSDVAYWLGTSGAGPSPPGVGENTSARWLTIKRGIRTKGARTSWDDDNTA